MSKKLVYLTSCLGLLVTMPFVYRVGGVVKDLKLMSSAFKNNGDIPEQYTCKGADSSPELQWAGAPGGTKSFALICSDPDAPGGTWIHWVVYDIPANVRSLPAGIQGGEELANGAKQGMSSFKKLGYGGPCPPSGVHHYHFDLFALDVMLGQPAGLNEEQLRKAMDGHILKQVRLTGLFAKQTESN